MSPFPELCETRTSTSQDKINVGVKFKLVLEIVSTSVFMVTFCQ